MDAACVQADLRRLLVAQFAFLFGSEDMKGRIGRLLEGGLDEDDAWLLRADLDGLARQLLG